MSRSNFPVGTGQHAARFGPTISEYEYQKAVQTLHWRLRTANTGTPRQSHEESYKLTHGWTQSENPKYSGQISSLCRITLCEVYREVSLSL
jgi:hypothetical protein